MPRVPDRRGPWGIPDNFQFWNSTRLTTRTGRLNYEHVQSFRGAIYSRGQASGSSTHYDQVANFCLIDCDVQSQTIGELLNRGIFQHRTRAANDHWNFVELHLETVKQFLGSLVGVEIDIGVWMFIASKKFAQAEGVGRMPRTDQDDVALPLVYQLQPAQDESPHENFAQLRIPGNERPQGVPSKFQELARFGDAAPYQASPAGDHGHLARKLTGIVFCNQLLTGEAGLNNLHASGKQNEKRHICVTDVEQNFTLCHLAELAAGATRLTCAKVNVGKAWVRAFSALGTGGTPYQTPKFIP